MNQFTELSTVLRQLVGFDNGIKLLNIYKGLPISYDSTLRAIGEDSIIVETSKYQAVCLYLDRHTYLQSHHFLAPMKATLQAIDIPSLQVRLGDLHFVSEGIGDRQQVRVEPAEVIHVQINFGSSRTPIDAELANISQTGMAVYLPNQVFSYKNHAPRTEVVVELPFTPASPHGYFNTRSLVPQTDPMDRFSRERLRGTASLIDSSRPAPIRSTGNTRPLSPRGRFLVPGTVLNIKSDYQNQRMRLGIQLYPSDDARAAISTYISQRQSELIREIKMMYDLIVKLDRP